MFWTQGLRKALIMALGLWIVTGQAAPPDPIEFDWAIESNQIDKVRTWLNEGLNPEFQGNSLGTGLMVAAWHGNIPMMALFIERGANPRRVNRNGEQPLQLAAWNGHMEAVKWLLDHGAALNRDPHHWSGLHYAVFNGHMDIARYLIERGAEVNARSPNGSTPLMLAAREGRDDMAKLLLESGADTQPKNEWGDTALMMAVRYEHFQLGKIISSPEEFELAIKTPRENFGEPTRSAAAPSEIETLLKRIREAEAGKRSTEALRKQLSNTITQYKRNSPIAINAARRPMPLPYQPRSLVITARRGSLGQEQAQFVVRKPAPQTPTMADRSQTQRQIGDLLRQIRLAQAQGRPTEALRKQLYETVERLK